MLKPRFHADIKELRDFTDAFDRGQTEVVTKGAVKRVIKVGVSRAGRVWDILAKVDIDDAGARAAAVMAHQELARYHAALAKLINKAPPPSPTPSRG